MTICASHLSGSFFILPKWLLRAWALPIPPSRVVFGLICSPIKLRDLLLCDATDYEPVIGYGSLVQASETWTSWYSLALKIWCLNFWYISFANCSFCCQNGNNLLNSSGSRLITELIICFIFYSINGSLLFVSFIITGN